jgi:hypothetical protein
MSLKQSLYWHLGVDTPLDDGFVTSFVLPALALGLVRSFIAVYAVVVIITASTIEGSSHAQTFS